MAHRSPPNAGPYFHVGPGAALFLAGSLALASSGSPAMGADAKAQPLRASPVLNQSPASHAITTITLERNCFGCPSASTLVLQRDGSATYTVTGSARHGTPSAVSRGAISRDDFDALARLALGNGFFALADTYADPQVQDGAWAITSIAREGTALPVKRVFRREDAAPPALRAVETAIESVQERIAFKPERP